MNENFIWCVINSGNDAVVVVLNSDCILSFASSYSEVGKSDNLIH